MASKYNEAVLTQYLMMARPLSEDKRQMIMGAATRLFAQEGLSASTARIAKEAGVAEGTLFIYFATKDDLTNQLYLGLKAQLRLAYVDLPHAVELRENLWQFWSAYLRWGLAHPVQRQAMAKLQVSDRITDQTRASAAEGFQDVIALLVKAQALGGLRRQPTAFVGSLLVAMAEATIDLIASNRKQLKAASDDSFCAFWRAVATS